MGYTTRSRRRYTQPATTHTLLQVARPRPKKEGAGLQSFRFDRESRRCDNRPAGRPARSLGHGIGMARRRRDSREKPCAARVGARRGACARGRPGMHRVKVSREIGGAKRAAAGPQGRQLGACQCSGVGPGPISRMMGVGAGPSVARYLRGFPEEDLVPR